MITRLSDVLLYKKIKDFELIKNCSELCSYFETGDLDFINCYKNISPEIIKYKKRRKFFILDREKSQVNPGIPIDQIKNILKDNEFQLIIRPHQKYREIKII